MRNPLYLLPLVLLTACPAHEGPIDVILIDIDGDTVIEWAEAGSDDFVLCENATTSPDATVGCGPYGAGDPGDYTIRVQWRGDTVHKDVTVEKDGSYEANVRVTFTAEDFATDEADDDT